MLLKYPESFPWLQQKFKLKLKVSNPPHPTSLPLIFPQKHLQIFKNFYQKSNHFSKLKFSQNTNSKKE